VDIFSDGLLLAHPMQGLSYSFVGVECPPVGIVWYSYSSLGIQLEDDVNTIMPL